MDLDSVSRGWNFTMSSSGKGGTHSRLFFSILASLVPSAFIVLKSFWFSFPSISSLHMCIA